MKYSVFALVFLFSLAPVLNGQTQDTERPVPLLTGNAGFFTNVNGGENQLVPEINPILLIPFGERWLVESRAEFTGEFERPEAGGPYGGKVEQEISYLQLDFIANPYMTVTVGRFLTPFNIYNERLYPIWIRSQPRVPLIFPLETGSSDGAMLRGGFPVSSKANLNYAAYFSTLSTVNKFESNRVVGTRTGFFFPVARIEVGGSWQKELQEERTNAFGFYFAWQPPAIPLNLRSEYARSHDGSGYWVEGAYRLSQLPFWKTVMRRTEIVGRGQQFFAGQIDVEEAEEYGLPDVNTREGDVALNYYIRDGLKVTTSYGRQFSSDGNVNLWTVGIAYRFVFPLGRIGPR